jgi:hypothetical protein
MENQRLSANGGVLKYNNQFVKLLLILCISKLVLALIEHKLLDFLNH